MSDDVINIDDSIENADWTKQAWDLPPYKSTAFFAVVPLENLGHFRTTPVYQHAVANGLIHDDEWVGDYVTNGVDTLADAFLSALADAQLSDKK